MSVSECVGYDFNGYTYLYQNTSMKQHPIQKVCKLTIT